MQNRTVGIVATVITALLCGCFSIFSCVWGVIITSGQPIDVTSNNVTSQQTLPTIYGIGLLCLSVFMILIPVAVGYFTLRKKPETESVEVPPAE